MEVTVKKLRKPAIV